MQDIQGNVLQHFSKVRIRGYHLDLSIPPLGQYSEEIIHAF